MAVAEGLVRFSQAPRVLFVHRRQLRAVLQHADRIHRQGLGARARRAIPMQLSEHLYVFAQGWAVKSDQNDREWHLQFFPSSRG